MSIASRISSIEEHLRQSYQELEGIGIDTTGVNKNLENIPKLIDGYWETLPKVTGEGTSITLDNTKEGKMKINLKGNTSQETTTGKNLFNKESISWGTGYPIIYTTINIPNGTYTMSSPNMPVGTDNICNLFVIPGQASTGASSSINGVDKNTSRTLTITGGKITIANRKTTEMNTNDPYNYDWQLEKSATATDYEPYTNGASPNPNYPQDIHVVSGDNEIEVCGKNMFDDSVVTNLWSEYATQRITTVNGANLHRYECKQGDTFTLKATFETASGQGAILIQFFDKYGNSLGRNASSQNTTITLTKTAPVDTNYAYIGRYTVTPSTIQLEKNTQATTYEPYQSQSYAVNLGNIELCKIGDYQDSIKKSTGKNLCNTTFELGGIDTTTGQNGSGTDRVRTKDYVEIKANTTYTLSGVQGSRVVCFYNSSKAYLSYAVVGSQSTSGTFTTPNDTSYIRWYIIQTNTNINEMLNEGTTALPYEPYGKVWYLNKQIGKVVLNGSENWLYYLQANVSRFDTTITNAVKGSATNNPILSTHFKTEFALTNRRVFLSGSGNLISIIDNDFSNTNDFKNWLSSNNVTCYYGYTTPTYTEITDSTLISQLEALNGSKSYNPQTNISQENNDNASILNASALSE